MASWSLGADAKTAGISTTFSNLSVMPSTKQKRNGASELYPPPGCPGFGAQFTFGGFFVPVYSAYPHLKLEASSPMTGHDLLFFLFYCRV